MSGGEGEASSAAPARVLPDWVQEYNRALGKRSYAAPPKAGPHCCAVCCSVFASFAALFLFSVSGLMRNNYPYIHIHAPDLPGLATPVIYAGFLYLLIALISMCCWAQGNAAAKDEEDERAEEAAAQSRDAMSGAGSTANVAAGSR